MNTKETILVVDDSSSTLSFTCSLLQKEGYNTLSADSGEHALEYLATNIPDLILLDIVMTGIDGFEVCKRIKKQENINKIPIIFLTAAVETNQILEGLRLGASDYITKPFHKEELIARIKTHLNLHRYNQLFREQTAEKLIEHEIILKKKNIELEDRNTELMAYNEELQATTDALQETEIELNKINNKLTIAKENAEENEEKYRLLFEHITQGFALHEIILDTTGKPIDYRYLTVNPAFEKLTGIKANTIIGKRVLELLPQTEQYWIETFGKVALTGESINYENYSAEIGKDFETKVFSPKKGQFAVVFSDISERKQAEKALNHKLLALTSPLNQNESLSFSDLFNLEDIQQLQDQFAAAMGVASIITLPDGTPITKPSNFSNFCHQIRSTVKGAKNCQYSDQVIGRQNTGGPIVQKCLSGGLCDAGASITVDGKHIANWLIGQVKSSSDKNAFVEEYAQLINTDPNSLLNAYKEVTQLPDEKFRAVAQMLFTLAGQLSTMAFQNVTQAQLIVTLKQTKEDLLLKNNELLSAEEEIRASNEELEATNDALRENLIELQRAEEKLKQEHVLLRTIIDSIPDAIYVKDLNNRKVIANKADYQNMGFNNEKDAMGKNDFDIWPTNIAQALFDDDQQVTKYGKSIIDREEIISTSNNGVTHLLTTKLPLYDQNGQLKGLVGVGRNITKQKQAEEKLLAKNFELQSAEEEIRASNAELIAANYALLDANKELQRAEDEIRVANDKLLLMNVALDKHIKELEAAKLKVDEKELWLRESQRVGRIGTYQLNIETNKWESSELLNEIFGIDTSFEKDIAGWFSLIHPDQASEMLNYFEQHVIKERNMFDKEYKIVRKTDREIRWLWGRGELTFDEAGKPVKMIGTIQDITDKKTAEEAILIKNIELQVAEESIRTANEELVETNFDLYRRMEELKQAKEQAEASEQNLNSLNKKMADLNHKLLQTNIELHLAKEKAEEANRLKTAFLHNISHEIRTPLNAIVGFSDLLLNREYPQEQTLQFTQIIHQGSEQLTSVITDIINIATIEAGQLKIYEKKTDINNIITTLFSQFILKVNEKELDLSYTLLHDADPLIHADETKVTQILSNLIDNAIKFTDKGKITYGCNCKDNFLQFYVSDSGIGIDKKMQEKIFDRFTQGKTAVNREYGGNGLGLSISKAYAELLNGEIWLESEVNKGSIFYFKIPYKPVKANVESE